MKKFLRVLSVSIIIFGISGPVLYAEDIPAGQSGTVPAETLPAGQSDSIPTGQTEGGQKRGRGLLPIFLDKRAGLSIPILLSKKDGRTTCSPHTPMRNPIL